MVRPQTVKARSDLKGGENEGQLEHVRRKEAAHAETAEASLQKWRSRWPEYPLEAKSVGGGGPKFWRWNGIRPAPQSVLIFRTGKWWWDATYSYGLSLDRNPYSIRLRHRRVTPRYQEGGGRVARAMVTQYGMPHGRQPAWVPACSRTDIARF